MTRLRELTLTGVLLCATAAVLGVPALYAPGIAALLAGPVAALWVSLSARRCELELSCSALSAEEDEPVQVSVTLRRGILPFPGGTLAAWPGAQELDLRAERTIEVAGLAAIGQRGRHVVGPARLSVTDPFGLSTRRRVSEGSELLVLPRIHRLDAAALGFLDGVGRSSREPPREPDSLQSHRPGSPASRIHWPTVARSGVLMERSMRSEQDARVLVELDALRPASEEDLDRAVRAAASICLHLARRGGCLVLLPGEARPSVLAGDLQAWPGLHARMALVQSGLALRRTSAARRGLSVIRVTASDDAAGALDAGPHCRLAAHPVPGLPTLFTLAGCSAQQIDGQRRARAA